MITWRWEDHPFGYPTDPDDYDFKSPRTPPFVSLAIQYEVGDELLRHAVEYPNRTIKSLSDDEKEQMKTLLTDWLETKLKEL